MRKKRISCSICDEEKVVGIHVYTTFICKECEEEIIQTDPENPRYQYFVDKLKHLNQSQQYS